MGKLTLARKKEILRDVRQKKFSCVRRLADWHDIDIPCAMKLIRDYQRGGHLPSGLVLPLEEIPHD